MMMKMMNDPVRGCDVYKNIGCSHVDGFLCDYPDCSILKRYKMNERIRELAEQAWVYQVRVYQDNGVRTYGEQEKVFDKEKFAELIVKECMDVVSRKCASPTAYQALVEHFGVEE